MNAIPRFVAASAHVDEAAIQPLPRSRKVYFQGARADVRVPMREISQTRHARRLRRRGQSRRSTSTTRAARTPTRRARIDIRAGLPALRAGWIEERGDTERLDGPSSRFGRERLDDPKLAELRFELKRLPRRAQARAPTSRRCTTRGAASSRRRWSSSRSARTCAGANTSRARGLRPDAAQARAAHGPPAPRRIVRRVHSRGHHAASSCATRWRAAAPSSPPTSTTRRSSRWPSAATSW